MNGVETYNNNYRKKIDNVLEKNSDLNLRGFVNYIHNSSLSTRYNYLNYIIKFRRHIKRNVEELTIDDYTEYICTLEDSTPSYQIAVYSALKLYSSYLVVRNISKTDYMLNIPRPKFRESQKTIIKRENAYLDDEEIKTYLANVKTGIRKDTNSYKHKEWESRDMLMAQIFLNTGIRCSALYKLDVNSIDFIKKTLIVTDKGGYTNEYVVSDGILDLARIWLKDRSEKGVPKSENALFISSRLKRMHVNSISNVVSKYAKGVKDIKFSPHKLRATYGTQLYDKTRDIYLVQQCMGHSSPKTSELYVRGQKNSSREKAADIMAQITNI